MKTVIRFVLNLILIIAVVVIFTLIYGVFLYLAPTWLEWTFVGLMVIGLASMWTWRDRR